MLGRPRSSLYRIKRRSLGSVKPCRIHGKCDQEEDLGAVSHENGNDPRRVDRGLVGLEGKGANDVAHAVRDEEDGVDGRPLRGAGRVGSDERHDHGE